MLASRPANVEPPVRPMPVFRADDVVAGIGPLIIKAFERGALWCARPAGYDDPTVWARVLTENAAAYASTVVQAVAHSLSDNNIEEF